MTFSSNPLRPVLISAVLLTGLLGASASFAQTGVSQYATWTCTSSPCPWGSSTSGDALAWPSSAGALAERLGYTVSSSIYLPASVANGTVIAISSGSVSLFAGAPNADSHNYIGSIYAGDSYQVSGLAAGEVLSVQSSANFGYTVTFPAPPPPPPPPPPVTGTASQSITWTCTGTPCPWGSSTTGHAMVWPASGSPTSARLGYTTSGAIYLPAQYANGTNITLNSGAVTLYAGVPGADSHRFVANIAAGGNYSVSGLAPDEVLSVQSSSSFSYAVTLGTPSTTPPPDPEPPVGTGPASQFVTWTCTGTECPWGASTSGQALVWSEAANALNTRLGYTTSKAIYLPTEVANGTVIWIDHGSASLYVGLPNASSHRLVASLGAGDFYAVQGLAAGEVLSVQGSARFEYSVSLPEAPISDPDDIHSIAAYWRCNLPGCDFPDWGGAVINWPSWAAYNNNARTGENSRTVYSANNQLLHPYMGSWANGCQVTAKSGIVLIIEWERGTDVWRQTYLAPGETHTISLTSPENGAMIETYDFGPAFSVELHNCTPQPVP